MFELRVGVHSFSGTGLALPGVCSWKVISPAVAQLGAAGAEPRVGTNRKAAVVGQGFSLRFALLAVMCVCVCAGVMRLRMKISCLNSFSCLMPVEEELPTIFILTYCCLSTLYCLELTAAAFPVINIYSLNCTFEILSLFSYF